LLTVVDEGGAVINGATIALIDTDRGTVYTSNKRWRHFQFRARFDSQLSGEGRSTWLPAVYAVGFTLMLHGT
jgi:hypothetical protein